MAANFGVASANLGSGPSSFGLSQFGSKRDSQNNPSSFGKKIFTKTGSTNKEGNQAGQKTQWSNGLFGATNTASGTTLNHGKTLKKPMNKNKK